MPQPALLRYFVLPRSAVAQFIAPYYERGHGAMNRAQYEQCVGERLAMADIREPIGEFRNPNTEVRGTTADFRSRHQKPFLSLFPIPHPYLLLGRTR